MVAKLIAALIESYHLDIVDYNQLKLKMQEFFILLEQNEKNKKREKSPIQDYASELADRYEQSLREFCSYREKTFEKLQKRAYEEKKVQNQACYAIGIDSFEIDCFKMYLSENVYNELISVTDLLREKMAYILVMDKDLIHKLSQNLEELKLDIHRMESVKKTRNAYSNKVNYEAIYIDRSK
ncbi:MAG: hypothetical protein APF84_14875 [Gracilibacter sp. BRH_c7a]|nr:MAG: hypothetical protein APF84_14875 [Gracilibacter sp. BRH_c7a]